MNQEQTINISTIRHVPIGVIAKYEVETLYLLLEQASEKLECARRTKQWVESAINLKYQEQVRAKRQRLAKDTGIIHLDDGNFRVSSTLPKKIVWDQTELTKIAAEIVLNGGKLEDYCKTYYKVHETEYNNWSETVKSFFKPARKIFLGKATYSLTNLNLNSEVDYE